ncbi:MAG: molybdenum cofactor biosynthesis protein MoaE [Phycisphaerae bacterium]
MTVHVVFLGPSRDLAGAERAVLELAAGSTVRQLRDALEARFDGLRGRLAAVRFAVNEVFAKDDTALSGGDEVAVIPPVSGGSAPSARRAHRADGVWVELLAGPIPVDHVRSAVTGDPTLGGVCTFEGATRRDVDEHHGPLVRLEYEAYAGMALSELKRLADDAARRWPVGRLVVVHRIGAVPPGEASVVIAVACPHRADAFDACRWLIDTLKRDVPIWKREVFENGHVRWGGGAA